MQGTRHRARPEQPWNFQDLHYQYREPDQGADYIRTNNHNAPIALWLHIPRHFCIPDPTISFPRGELDPVAPIAPDTWYELGNLVGTHTKYRIPLPRLVQSPLLHLTEDPPAIGLHDHGWMAYIHIAMKFQIWRIWREWGLRLGLYPVSDGYNELRFLVWLWWPSALCHSCVPRVVLYSLSRNSFNFLWLSLV